MKTYTRKRQALRAARLQGSQVHKADYTDKFGRPTGRHFYIVGTWRAAHEFVSGRSLQAIK